MKLILIAGLAASLFGGDCLPYGQKVVVTGRIVHGDAHGYAKYVVLELDHPLCTLADKDGDPAEDDIPVLGPSTQDEELADRLERLKGARVHASGTLHHVASGFPYIPIRIELSKIEPADAAAKRALLMPRVGIVVRSVESFTAVIKTGPRLQIEARDDRSKDALEPADEYIYRFMTGGEVLWVDCAGPYERTSAQFDQQGAGLCDENAECAFSDPFGKPSSLTFQCKRRE